MRNYLKKSICAVLLGVFLFGAFSGINTAGAQTPYKTYTIDGYGYVTETQTAYTPYSAITKILYRDDSSDLEEDTSVNRGTALFEPMDFCIVEDNIYIADTGNRRVVVSDTDGYFLFEIAYEEFVYPCGIFVTPEGRIYVADRDAKAVFIFDKEGNLELKITKPNHPLYGEAMEFKPMKIVVNHGGIMFVISYANTNGIIQLSEADGGTFLGYFGTNSASDNWYLIFRRMIATEAQRATLPSNIPATPDNLAIDSKGLIYTVTRGEELETLKKLNIAGVNMIEEKVDAYDEIPAAVTVGNYENIYMASATGYIYEFSGDGELLFVFGGGDDGFQRVGLCKIIRAICVDSQDRIYVLDSDMSQIQIYEPTEFTDLLHEALYLYAKGRYTQSKAPLSQILTMNSLFDYANKAMARAYLQEEDYETALHYAKIAKDYETYSDAFWEIRNIWLQKNLIAAVLVAAALVIVWKVTKYLLMKYGVGKRLSVRMEAFGDKKLVRQLRYALYFIKHPVDGCYGVRREGKCSYLCANLIITAYIALFVMRKYFSGFIFKMVREGRYDIMSDIGLVVCVFAVMTFCCYLISTINDGEGRFRQIYCGFAYSLTPYLLLTPVIFVLSHLLTYNEAFLCAFASYFMLAWIGVLIFVTIKEINNYTVAETIKVILLSLFCAFILALLVFIIYVLWNQVFEFLISILREAVYRLGF